MTSGPWPGSALLVGALLLGCQGDNTRPPPPAPPPPPADAAPAPDAAPVAGEPTHIRLPRSPSTPVHRTTRPLDLKELERLAAITHQDFEHSARITTAKITEFRHTTGTRPKLSVTVTIQPCERGAGRRSRRSCPAMDLATWKPQLDELKHALPPELLARRDTRFELGATQVSGAPAIYTYQLGHAFGKDKHDQPTGSYTDVYTLYYNDGVQQVRVAAAYDDDALSNLEQLSAVAPEEDLAKLANAFLSFYLHEWK